MVSNHTPSIGCAKACKHVGISVWSTPFHSSGVRLCWTENRTSAAKLSRPSFCIMPLLAYRLDSRAGRLLLAGVTPPGQRPG